MGNIRNRKDWLVWGGGAVVGVALGWALVGPAAAQQPAVEVAGQVPAAETQVAPGPAPPVPNIHEVGRVGFVELSDSRANIKIQQGNQVATMPRETSVAEVADQVEDAVVTGPSGVIGAEALERQTALHLTSLAGCRLEVARKRRITLDAVVAGRMTLRWTILPTGLTGETEVVAREPVDPQVVDCIKRRMSLWEFSHPRGGPVRVARVLTLPDAVRTAK